MYQIKVCVVCMYVCMYVCAIHRYVCMSLTGLQLKYIYVLHILRDSTTTCAICETVRKS